MTCASAHPLRRWWVLAAVTLIFFFLNAATFTSLGVALYSMIAELHWSQTAAGFSFSLLGVACGLSSPLPAALMRRFGGRLTIVLGGLTLTLGFGLAAMTRSLAGFYLAMTLVGVGYSLAANVPGVYVISAWFPHAAPRMIGIYLMGGSFGSVVGAPMVHAIIVASSNWRMYWLVMAVAAMAISGICLGCIRDVKPATSAGQLAPAPQAELPWSYRAAIRTPQFLWVAAAMALTMACVTTVHSVAVTHLTQLGATEAFAALSLGITALVMTLSNALAGSLCERLGARPLLAGGLALQTLGVILFAGANSGVRICAFAVAYGAGWGIAYLAATVLLLEYFGRELGSQVLASVWLLSTIAAAGPFLAGMIGDRFGSFGPIFYAYAVVLLLVAYAIGTMATPVAVALHEAGNA